ncbi:MAG: hypothetical protein JNM43_01415 [Planctomycetaceae bacterium]|nr:hypothetical protein [Planctomycetaceae bacterium]
MNLKRWTLKALVVLTAAAGLTVESRAADVWGLNPGTPDMKSATTLAFGPEDILFIGDAQGAAVFAVATGNTKGDPSKASVNIENLPSAIATELHAKNVVINDLAVNPRTGTAFVAVTADDKPAIAQIDGDGKISALGLSNVKFAKAALADAPEDKVVGEGRRAQNRRTQSITDIAFFENKVLVAGLSNAAAPSTVRELNFPFAEADKGMSVEIYHAAHGKSEDYAAMRTFVPMMIDGEPAILGAYVCTPLVKIPVKQLEGAAGKVKATTVAELGNRNAPLDMISYKKDGADYLLLSNSARGVMKITTAGLKENKGLTEPVGGGGTAGQKYETVEALAGTVQMDKLNETSALVLVQAEGGPQNLKTVALP